MASTPQRLLRFDGVERLAHWLTALLFLILMVTALPLYFGSLAGLVGRRVLLVEIHVWSGVALPVPLLVSLAGPWGARLRRDVRRVCLWTEDELAWLWTLGRGAPMVRDKFNPGQKLNTIFTAAVIVLMLATGSILKWFRFFPLEWRTGATFVHDVLALLIFLVVIGHVVLALTHRDAMRSMVRGFISESWAARHAPGWLEQVRSTPPTDAVARVSLAQPPSSEHVRR